MAMLVCMLSMTAMADEGKAETQKSGTNVQSTGETVGKDEQPNDGGIDPDMRLGETADADIKSDGSVGIGEQSEQGVSESDKRPNGDIDAGEQSDIDVIEPDVQPNEDIGMGEQLNENAASSVNGMTSDEVSMEPAVVSEEEQGIEVHQASGPRITYFGHVENIGDQAAVSDGGLCGTEGRFLRVEALTIQKGEAIADIEGDITYRAHVQNYGTMGWVRSGQRMGTSNQGLRIEAIQIALTGNLAQLYDVYYSVHVQNLGWMKWTKGSTERNGWCGTMGQGLRVEAIKVMLVRKDEQAPVGGGSQSFISYDSHGDVEYRTHQQNIGDHAWVKNQEESGVTGRFLRLEAMQIRLSNMMYSGSVQYRSHVQNIGWTDWVSDGAVSGTNGWGLRMEAIQVQLTGEIANHCDIWYRVHVQDIGWMGWAVNGQAAGTENLSRRVESIQVVLVPKGFKGPGKNENYFQQFSSPEMYDAWRLAQGMSSRTNYLILINNAACRVFIFQGSQGNWKPLHDWVCSPGKPWTPTVRGNYTIGARGTHFGEDKGYTCYYWTQFYGDYLFHSILYYPYSMRVQEGELGKQLSHGCVRLSIENARWIYDNIPRGTQVYSY